MVVIDNIQQTPGVLENDQKLLTPILSSLEISVKVYLFFLGYSFASVNLIVQIGGDWFSLIIDWHHRYYIRNDTFVLVFVFRIALQWQYRFIGTVRVFFSKCVEINQYIHIINLR